MTDKKTALKIVIPATLAIALGLAAWSGAVRHVTPIDQPRGNHSVTPPEVAELPNPALSRVRLLVSNLN
jgi:hypothetical protein